MTSAIYFQKGQTVEVEFPDGWCGGWTISAVVPDCHKDTEGRTFKHRYNVRHEDGRELREIHPLCARPDRMPGQASPELRQVLAEALA